MAALAVTPVDTVALVQTHGRHGLVQRNLSLDSSDPFPSVMIDVDGSSQVNDRLGHHVGDRVLQDIGRVLLANVRSRDPVICYGGEFLLVAPESSVCEENDALLRRLRSSLAAWHEESAVPVSLTLFGGGAHGTSGEGRDWVDVVEEADRSMYDGKAERAP